MNELVAKIKELSNAFFMDAELQTEKGNKYEYPAVFFGWRGQWSRL